MFITFCCHYRNLLQPTKLEQQKLKNVKECGDHDQASGPIRLSVANAISDRVLQAFGTVRQVSGNIRQASPACLQRFPEIARGIQRGQAGELENRFCRTYFESMPWTSGDLWEVCGGACPQKMGEGCEPR